MFYEYGTYQELFLPFERGRLRIPDLLGIGCTTSDMYLVRCLAFEHESLNGSALFF